MKKKALFIVVAVVLMSGCTDAGIGKITALGNPASIKCWSGGKLIFEGRSTGKVRSEQNSDGYFFKDSMDQKIKEVSGNCVIEYDR